MEDGGFPRVDGLQVQARGSARQGVGGSGGRRRCRRRTGGGAVP
jgi:hypothetical protein